MGLKVTEEQLLEWRRKGLIRGEAAAVRLTNAPAKKKRADPKEMVEESFDLDTRTWVIPIRTESIANARGEKAMIGKKGKEKRTVIMALGKCHRILSKYADFGVWKFKSTEVIEVIVRFTRLGPRVGRMDPDENLRMAFKYVKDAVAEMLGCDDRDPRLKWEYAEEIHPKIGIKIQMRFA